MLGTFEQFEYRKEQWTRFPAPRAEEAFIAGVDLGQSQDPTAIIVMETHARRSRRGPSTRRRTTRQEFEEHFDVVHAERLPLGTSYPDIVHTCGTC